MRTGTVAAAAIAGGCRVRRMADEDDGFSMLRRVRHER